MRAKEDQQALEQARPGYHDPTTALGGTPALSPLTLRLRLAAFGLAAPLLGMLVFGAWLHVTPIAVACAVAFVLVAVTAVVDLAVIQHRRHQGEPG
jgi:hypothetical protein